MKKSKNKYIRSFNRFELKYLLHYTQVQKLVKIISPYVISDENMGRDGFYKITSLYYDSSDLKCYWEKVNGEKYRQKLRIRTYGDNPDSAFLEIKQRYNLTVQKQRCQASIQEIESTMHKIIKGGFSQSKESVYNRAFNLVRSKSMNSKVMVSYNRMAFFDKYKKDLRITIDRNIKCRNLSLDFFNHQTKGKYAIPPTMMILELKFNETIPSWLCTCLNSMDLQIMRISKYCHSIERTQMHIPFSFF